MDWAGTTWTGLGPRGLGWDHVDWAGTMWTGLGPCGLGWDHVDWAQLVYDRVGNGLGELARCCG